jgi:DNA helicase II / ATP-dependent DNA helicase PcrA
MQPMPDFFEQVLNSEAYKICVIAAPGSGKTSRILIPKATRILLDDDIDPKEVLLLTFSRLSAIDLKNKVKTLERTPRASTVHSFCLAFLLSEDNHEIRKRVESIVLDFEKESLIADLKHILPHIGKRDLKKRLEEFSAGWATQPHDQVFEKTEDQRKFKLALINWLSEHEAAMMEEIVYHAVDLAKHLDWAPFLEQPEYIFVDEFQDLNRLEQEFIEILAANSELLLVVGDPDQSIYSFKYAHPVGISEFSERADVERHSHLVTGRCPWRVVAVANQLLQQASPGRTELLQPLESAELGEVHFVQKQTQAEEFAYSLASVAGRIRSGVKPTDIIVLVPRKKLGREFVQYANAKKQTVGMNDEAKFAFILKPEFNEKEKERVLLFSLLVKRDSLLHIRAYVGLADDNHFAPEIAELKHRYGSLANVFKSASRDDFPKQKRRVRTVCSRIIDLHKFLEEHAPDSITVDTVIEELFPAEDQELQSVRKMLDQLREQEDTPEILYSKFVDYIRTVPHEEDTVRVMTLMASKGLEADHVYILGCNAGNLPGSNRSAHITDFEHQEEQRRLLYVGFTRAKKSLTVSWSRYMPFRQSKGHHTGSVGTIKIDGKVYSRVAISPFLQDLSGVTWEA